MLNVSTKMSTREAGIFYLECLEVLNIPVDLTIPTVKGEMVIVRLDQLLIFLGARQI